MTTRAKRRLRRYGRLVCEWCGCDAVTAIDPCHVCGKSVDEAGRLLAVIIRDIWCSPR